MIFINTRRIEVCCGSMADVLTARSAGAIRVELCSAIEVGGLTPSAGLIAGAVRERSAMAVNVLIRPRGGDFVYSDREIAVMEADIEAAKAAGAQGVVIGAMTPSGDVDMKTIHRAFDVCASPSDALEQIIALGIPRLLTSGREPTALEGAPLIAELIRQAAGRIRIMPGAGINPANIAEIESITGAKEFHSTCTDKSLSAPCRAPLFGCAARPADFQTVKYLVTGMQS